MDKPNSSINRPSILIVDDEELICELLDEYLAEDFQVKAISNPEQALEIIRTNQFDLIITDLNMPKINGLEIISEAKKCSPNTPVIIMSGSDKIEAQNALKLGATDILTKPFLNLKDLMDQLKKYV